MGESRQERRRQGRSELISRAQGGDRAAWDRLAPMYLPLLTTEALLLLRQYLSGPVSDEYRRQLAEEIAASAFGTAALQIDQARRDFWTDWLRATVRNETFQAVRPEVRAMTSWLAAREEARRRERDLDTDPALDPSEAASRGELRALLEFHLTDPDGCVPAFARETARLRWVNGLREREIARAAGKDPKAVRRELHIAATHLVRALVGLAGPVPEALEQALIERLARFEEEHGRGPRRPGS
jgi:DNA-directed RNA polymerase specialized sigma24 family protein